MSSPAFVEIEHGIRDATEKVAQFGRALDRLTSEGLYGYLHELSKDEKRDLDRQIKVLEALQEKSKELEKALRTARDELQRNKGILTKKQRDAQSQIIQLEEDIKLEPFKQKYERMKEDHDNIVGQIKVIQGTLRDVKSKVKVGADSAKRIVEKMEKGLPRVTKIYVKASTEVFAKDEPLIFEVWATYDGNTDKYRVEWKPGKSVSDFYQEVAHKLLA